MYFIPFNQAEVNFWSFQEKKKAGHKSENVLSIVEDF